jgi:predicted 2-oxoglutarate/Fe(II)-dependent dioxygenase YbiX
MNDLQRLSKLIAKADADSAQAAKDGRQDAASQWAVVANEYRVELVAACKAKLAQVIQGAN